MTLVKKDHDLEYHIELILSGNIPIGAIVTRKEFFGIKKRELLKELKWVFT